VWFLETSGFLVSCVVCRQPNADQKNSWKSWTVLFLLIPENADTSYGAYVVHVSTITLKQRSSFFIFVSSVF